VLEQIRSKVLKKYQPEVWNYIQDYIHQYGYVVINIGCGLMSFGSMNPVDAILTGFWGESGYDGDWHLGNCQTCPATNVEVGLCNVCRKCQREFDLGLRH
jgi:hypothetical protein